MAGPLALFLLPKCPLCLLPLVATLGIAIPSGPLLNGIFVAVVVVWASLFAISASSMRMRALLVVVGAIAIGGRLVAWMPLELLGIALMLLLGITRIIGALRGRAACGSCVKVLP